MGKGLACNHSVRFTESTPRCTLRAGAASVLQQSDVVHQMKDIRICFVGDSFVNGMGDESALGWAGRLCRDAHGQGIPVTGYNLGVRRETSRDICRRLEAECTPRLPADCDGRIVLSCGVNDTMWEKDSTRVPFEESVANLDTMLGFASSVLCLVVGPPPVDDDEHNHRIESLSAAFAGLARERGVPFIDLFGPLADEAAYRRAVQQGDGAHPESTGYARMTEVIASSPDWWFRG
ncbi:GDSL-type esterase/lipase family protein [Guyparkeria halophila]|uniref:GDSL-type esterase/lipase family protein n=1 Tax=Guyparkeria halophila TaxID=47960 RepID=A0ABZ0YU45_9GAMM|nr:GDSL-type esterase/lipase family protein [Guyparkeria halophila]WQH15687.1 GDSL-type esterase/lipase family protein [Guyparkeria halophila]